MRNGKKKKKKRKLALSLFGRGAYSLVLFLIHFGPFGIIWDHSIGRMDDYRSLYLSLFYLFYFIFFIFFIFHFYISFQGYIMLTRCGRYGTEYGEYGPRA